MLLHLLRIHIRHYYKGKFGACGVMWPRKAKKSHQETGESQKFLRCVCYYWILAFLIAVQVDDNPNEQLWHNATIQRKA